jgi:outer membrane protein
MQFTQYAIKTTISMKKHVLAALAFVAVFSFTNCKNANQTTPSVSEAPKTVTADNAVALAAAKVVYVNIDSLQEKYTWFKQQKAAFEQKEKNLMQSLENKAQAFQNEYIALQQKAQGGTVPPAELERQGQAMQQKQQSIVAERERRTKELLEETQKFNENLMKQINDVLATLQTAKGFDYVLRHSKDNGAPMLYVNEKLDITNDVLAILNAQKKN